MGAAALPGGKAVKEFMISGDATMQKVGEQAANEVKPPVGFEPTTSHLLSGCSAN